MRLWHEGDPGSGKNRHGFGNSQEEVCRVCFPPKRLLQLSWLELLLRIESVSSSQCWAVDVDANLATCLRSANKGPARTLQGTDRQKPPKNLTIRVNVSEMLCPHWPIGIPHPSCEMTTDTISRSCPDFSGRILWLQLQNQQRLLTGIK